MFEKFPSLLGFQPRFYPGGPTRFHLALLYDLVANRKPQSIVTLGFGDGQAFFTLCQAARELRLETQCVASRRDRDGENAANDRAWLEGKDYGEEFYGERVRFFEQGDEAITDFADGGVDLLFVDDSDSGEEIRRDLAAWQSKLAPDALVMMQGTALQRADDPGSAWLRWTAARSAIDFPDGCGLGLAAPSGTVEQFGGEDVRALYRLAAARIEAQARADRAVEKQAALSARQIWLDSLLADRWRVQEIMDDQERRFEALLTDRKQAQLVMDSQHEQLKRWVAETDKAKAEAKQLKTQLKEQKKILTAAKQACRKDGRCFQIERREKEASNRGKNRARNRTLATQPRIGPRP